MEDHAAEVPHSVVLSDVSLRRRRILGVFCLLGVILLWVGSSELAKFVFVDAEFNKPMFTCFLSTSMFSLYLFGFILPSWRKDADWRNLHPRHLCPQLGAAFYCKACCGKCCERCGSEGGFRRHAAIEEEEALDAERLIESAPLTSGIDAEHSVNASPVLQPTPPKKPLLTVAETVVLSILFCPLWFVANYTYNLALTLTSAASTNILSTTSSLFTLILGAIGGTEKLSVMKALAVAVTIGGATIVQLQDGVAGETFYGDFLALLSAVGYALYSVLLQRLVKDDERLRAAMFFGFVGATCIAFLWPLFFIFSASGLEPFEWPSPTIWGFLMLNAILGSVVSDLLWVRAVLLTSPTVATVGLALTIPVTMVADAILHASHFTAEYICGAMLVVVGFVLVTLADRVSGLLRPRLANKCGRCSNYL